MYIYATRTVTNAAVSTTVVAMSDLPFSVPYPQRLNGVQHIAGQPIAPINAFIKDNTISWGHAACTATSQFDIFGVIKVTA